MEEVQKADFPNHQICETDKDMDRGTKRDRRTMSVKEMGDLLGLKRTERYWLIHKNFFKTVTVAGKMRVDLDSFETWYANQVKYRKVTGEEPGRILKEWTYSPQEIGELLGICEQAAYDLIKRQGIETVMVDYLMRIPKDSFQQWYAGQNHYLTKEDRESELMRTTITMPQMAAVLGIHRSNVYTILKAERYADFFDFIVIGGRRRITKESFQRFLEGQNRYRLVRHTAPGKGNEVANDRDSSRTGDVDPYTVINGSACLCDDYSKNENDTFCTDAFPAADVPASTAGIANTLSIPGPSPAENKTDRNDYITISEAAALSGLSRQSISRYAGLGSFRSVRQGSLFRIFRPEFEKWMDQNGRCRA